ncbi:iron uptake system protein EfeO [Ureibacillus sp. FSL K6-3587]|uniref:iron uptake system protein EfeO n=1 Tax=Ureibacillus sp. FSL K6-3587 TaxID=2954681 RepID=UPI0031596482
MAKKIPVYSALLIGALLLGGCGEEATNKDNESKTQIEQKENQAGDFSVEVTSYQEFALDQIDQFLVETEKFVNLIKAGDIEGAKALYPLVRMYYERSEPIAESFGDLDPRIDGRLADIQEEGKGEEEWTGYHKLEYALWVENTTKGYEDMADQLLADVKELHALVQTVEVTPDLLITGAVDLLNEVSTSKITGEEEIYSHTDLYDFKANVEGAEKIFSILREKLEKKDKELVKTLDERFKTVNELLAKYETADGGFVSYEELTEEDTKALASAVNQLGEPLSQMGIVLE